MQEGIIHDGSDVIVSKSVPIADDDSAKKNFGGLLLCFIYINIYLTIVKIGLGMQHNHCLFLLMQYVS